jgi:hypothetical protein
VTKQKKSLMMMTKGAEGQRCLLPRQLLQVQRLLKLALAGGILHQRQGNANSSLLNNQIDVVMTLFHSTGRNVRA